MVGHVKAAPVADVLLDTYNGWKEDYDRLMCDSGVNDNAAGLAWINGNHAAAKDLCNNDPTVVCGALVTDPEMGRIVQQLCQVNPSTFDGYLEQFNRSAKGSWSSAPAILCREGDCPYEFSSWWHFVAFRFLLRPYWEKLEGAPEVDRLDFFFSVSGMRGDQDVQIATSALMPGGTLRSFFDAIASGERKLFVDQPADEGCIPVIRTLTLEDPTALHEHQDHPVHATDGSSRSVNASSSICPPKESRSQPQGQLCFNTSDSDDEDDTF